MTAVQSKNLGLRLPIDRNSRNTPTSCESTPIRHHYSHQFHDEKAARSSELLHLDRYSQFHEAFDLGESCLNSDVARGQPTFTKTAFSIIVGV